MEIDGNSKKRDELQSVAQIMARSPLQVLVEKAQLLIALNRFVQIQLPTEFSSHCRVMNLDEKTLVLGADNAALATRIQFLSSDLVKALKKKTHFPVITHVRCRVLKISELSRNY